VINLGFEKYQGVLLPAEEVEVLNSLERLIGAPIPIVENLRWWDRGLIIRRGHVYAVGLGTCKLKALPENFGNLRLLEELWLSGNELESLPDSFQELTALHKLYLRHNKFSSLPQWFGNQKLLEILYISYNDLTFLPESIGNLSNLKQLYVNDNKLKYIPDSICKLANLEILNLRGNNLTSVPHNFWNLKKLNTLSLDNNLITQLPETFEPNLELKEISLSNNRLTTIPTCLWALKKLERLDLKNNPLKQEFQQALKENVQDIISFCRKRAPINIYIIFDQKDMKDYQIHEISHFLKSQGEIANLFYPEKTSEKYNPADTEFFKQYLSNSHLVLFLATENSVLNTSDAWQELQLAKKEQLGIIILLGEDLPFDTIKNIEFNISPCVPFLKQQLNEASRILHDYIIHYKRQVDLFDKYLGKFERNKLIVKNKFLEIIESKDFETYYYSNFDEISKTLNKMGFNTKNKARTLAELFKLFGSP
jgi:hypothetical protein